MKKFLEEFRTFAIKGNAIDMAVGIVIGGAFTRIVTSLVNDVIMPPIGYLAGGIDFSDKKIVLQAAVEGGPPEVALRYGQLINTFISFLIVALAMFLVIKAMNVAKSRAVPPPAPPPAPPAPSHEAALLTEIRDLLQNGSPPKNS